MLLWGRGRAATACQRVIYNRFAPGFALVPVREAQHDESIMITHAKWAALVCALSTTAAPAQESAHELADPPPFDQFLVIPLRVHVLASSELPEADCTLTDEDLTRILGKMNGVWHQAGIHFGVESIVREPAAGVDRFKEQRERSKGSPPLHAFRVLLPQASKDAKRLHVYYIHEFSVNGVYLGDGTALVKDTARLRPVPGGIDEPIPRVTAHELGHALGLPHRQARTNLLASGTTGTSFNEAEIAKARETAVARWGALPTAELECRAECASEMKDFGTARRLWTWLADVPGAGSGKATDQLARIALLERNAKPQDRNALLKIIQELRDALDAHP